MDTFRIILADLGLRQSRGQKVVRWAAEETSQEAMLRSIEPFLTPISFDRYLAAV